MKKYAYLMAASAILSFGQVAMADVTIRITGSTAFRAASVNGILNSMNVTGAGNGYAYSGTNFTGATFHIFRGTVTGIPGIVTVKTNWTGSVAGIRDTSAGTSIPFLPDATTISSGGTQNAAAPVANEGIPDIAFADNLQGSTTFTTPVLNSSNKVGIVPFAIVAGQNTLPSVTNITSQQLRALYTIGTIPSSLITGNPADTQPVYAAGRDPFSGTRLTFLAETGYGTQNVVSQFAVNNFTTTNQVNQINLFPATLAVPILGNDGLASGGTLANYLRYNTTNISDQFNGYTGPASFIGYIGEADSYAAVYGAPFSSLSGANQGNARYLSFNGVNGFGGVARRPITPNPPVATAGSAVIQLNNVGDTTGLIVGQIVSGNRIAPGSVIVSINTAANTITVDKNALSTGTSTNLQIGSLLPAALRNGSYSFWNFEYMLWKTSVVTGDKSTYAITLRNRVRDFDYGFSGLADDAAFTVTRGEDGGIIQLK